MVFSQGAPFLVPKHLSGRSEWPCCGSGVCEWGWSWTQNCSDSLVTRISLRKDGKSCFSRSFIWPNEKKHLRCSHCRWCWTKAVTESRSSQTFARKSDCAPHLTHSFMSQTSFCRWRRVRVSSCALNLKQQQLYRNFMSSVSEHRHARMIGWMTEQSELQQKTETSFIIIIISSPVSSCVSAVFSSVLVLLQARLLALPLRACRAALFIISTDQHFINIGLSDCLIRIHTRQSSHQRSASRTYLDSSSIITTLNCTNTKWSNISWKHDGALHDRKRSGVNRSSGCDVAVRKRRHSTARVRQENCTCWMIFTTFFT